MKLYDKKVETIIYRIAKQRVLSCCLLRFVIRVGFMGKERLLVNGWLTSR